MSAIEAAEKDLRGHVVWSNEETRGASFRAVTGYAQHDY